MEVLGLSEDELCTVLGADPLTVLSGQADDQAEVPILLALLAEARERAGETVLRRWLRTSGPRGVPLELLLGRDFAGFEDALAELGERGWILRGGGS
jgi:hypothetical protein